MKGLELARLSFEQVGLPVLEREVPQLMPRMAVGLAGEGSECFGFDDEFSRDHDWGAGFCIWLEEEDYLRYGAELRRVYEKLDWAGAGLPVRREQPQGAGRVGVISIQRWYQRYTACPEGPEELWQWRRVPEDFLATATNGQVFRDPMGKFSAIRDRLLEFYPEDLRLKKMAARAAAMAKSGQYNYPRCVSRGEQVAARLALADFTRAAMSMAYLLERRYMPYYKWAHRGMEGLTLLPGMRGKLERLEGVGGQDLIEEICRDVSGELVRQGLWDGKNEFLLDGCPQLMARIADPELRDSHVMEE